MEDSCHKTEGKYFQNSGKASGKRRRGAGASVHQHQPPWRNRAGFRRRLQSLAPMTGWYLPVPQAWKYSCGNMGKKEEWTSACSWQRQRLQPSARAPERSFWKEASIADFVPSVYDGDTLVQRACQPFDRKREDPDSKSYAWKQDSGRRTGKNRRFSWRCSYL